MTEPTLSRSRSTAIMRMSITPPRPARAPHSRGKRSRRRQTDLRKISGWECASIAGVSYRAGEAGAQATAQSERIRPWLVANRFQAVSQASMISARLVNTELASQWLRR
jgi:hypothetical protein